MNLTQSLVEMQNRPGCRTISAATHEHKAGEFSNSHIGLHPSAFQNKMTLASKAAEASRAKADDHFASSYQDRTRSAAERNAHLDAGNAHDAAASHFENASKAYSKAKGATGDMHMDIATRTSRAADKLTAKANSTK